MVVVVEAVVSRGWVEVSQPVFRSVSEAFEINKLLANSIVIITTISVVTITAIVPFTLEGRSLDEVFFLFLPSIK